MKSPKILFPAPRGSNVFAMIVGAAAGAGCLVWSRWLGELLGNTSGTPSILFLLGAIGFILGLRRDALGRRPVSSTGRTVGAHWMGLGALTLLLSGIGDSGTLLGWAGVPVGVGPWTSLAIQFVLGGVILIPVGFAAGSSLRCAARFSGSFSTSLPWGVFGAALGAATITGVQVSRGSSESATGMVVGLSGILLGIGFLNRRRTTDTSTERDESPEPTRWDAGGLALLLFSLAQVGPRIMALVFGNDLPSAPVAEFAFLTSLAIGIAGGLMVAGRIRPSATIGVVLGLVALSSVSAIFLLGNYTLLPERFAALAVTAESFDELRRAGLNLIAWRVGAAGLVLGIAVALVVSAGLQRSREPASWLARTSLAVMVGGILGTALPGVMISIWGIQGLLACVALGSTLAVTLSVAGSSIPRLVRLGLGLVSLGVVAAAVLQVPPMDAKRVLVERDAWSVLPTAPQMWLQYEGEDRRLSAVVLRRGHEKQILVNGRFEMAREASRKAHGMLAHLPLSIHSSPNRVLVLGGGTGWTTLSALAHPVEQIQCFENGRPLIEAAKSLGPSVARAFEDERVTVRIGDMYDLLLRSGPFEVILSHPSGAWTGRSAAACTREFLSAAHDRLTSDGVLAHWVPSESLTKTGLEILLATYSSVFAQVEVWDAGSGDVILLAKRIAAPHDFDSVLTSYRQPATRASAIDSWLATPETLLSHFLVDDATVRRIARGAPLHSRRSPQLGRAEAERRLAEMTMNPVPGLAALRRDATELFVNLPATGFGAAIQNVTEARDLARAAFQFERDQQPYDATDMYEQALELNPWDGSIRRGLATLRSRMGIDQANRQNFTAAHAYLREAVETDTTYAAGFANLGRLLSDSEDYDYAISVLTQAIQLAPDDDLFLLRLGRTWKAHGYLDKALPCYERAMEANPQNVDAGIGYVDTKLIMQGDTPNLQEGLNFLEAYLEVDPLHEELLLRIGKLDGVIQGRRR